MTTKTNERLTGNYVGEENQMYLALMEVSGYDETTMHNLLDSLSALARLSVTEKSFEYYVAKRVALQDAIVETLRKVKK